MNMNLKLNSKVDEYISLGIKLGLFDGSNLKEVQKKLSNITIIKDNNLTGDAEAIIEDGKNIIKINPQRYIGKEYYFLDEVLFHEFTHFVNEIHNDLYPSDNSKIFSFKKRYSQFSNNDELAQYPEWGAILLDEAIAQKVSQTMVETKYGKKIYALEPHQSKIFGESLNFYSTFADYPEFERVAENFSKSVVGNSGLLGFAKLSMKNECLDMMFSKYAGQSKGAEKLYKILGYMGNIAIADYASKGHFILRNSENLRKKENVVKSYHCANDIIDDMLSKQGPVFGD